MTSAEAQFQQKFDLLYEQFFNQLPEKIISLNKLWHAVKKNELASNNSLNALRLTIHSLVSTSETFSFDAISTAARLLETSIETIYTQQTNLDQEQIGIIEQDLFNLCNKMQINPHKTIPISNKDCCNEDNKVLIVDNDIETSSIIKDYLTLNGFIVETLPRPADLIKTVEHFKPSLILMEMVFEEGLTGAAAIKILRDNNHLTPVIFISNNNAMSSRLGAIRSGAYSYLSKPPDLDLLIARIRTACEIKPDLAYRVLLVDDDIRTQQLHIDALKSNSITVHAISDPMQTLLEIDKFKPELILLNVLNVSNTHKTTCSGLEVAMIIRQISELDNISVIFLTSEQDISTAMGSNNFMLKPVNPDHLKQTVQACIEKSRKLRASNNSSKALITKSMQKAKLATSANRTKSEFISKMSHELRTPLNSILGYTQLLELDHDGTLTAPQKDNLKHILGSGWHLLNLINDVLDISKIESGYLSLANTEINLNDVIEKSIKMNAKCANDKSISIAYHNQCNTDAIVNADATRLQQVIVNILSNAIKFNVDNGEVHITVTSCDNDTYKVTIKDTGMGLPENELHKLFTPFCRLSHEKTKIEGNGIGLALSAQLIELMKGEIGAYNNDGAGASFWFSLKQYHQSETTRTDSNQDVIKILHIEENDMELELLRQSLTAHRDVELFTARDAESALHVVDQITPDLILLDIELSSMDGLTMLNALRTKNHLKKTPIYALSSEIIPLDQQSLKVGQFHCYFSKPYNMSELLQSIDKLL